MSDRSENDETGWEGRIYVDIDDVLAHTAESLIDLLETHHGRRLEFESFLHFDLGESLGLTSEEVVSFFELAHAPGEIEGIRPIDGAAAALRAWGQLGYEVSLLTGRPPITDDATRNWLESSDMHFTNLGFVDKYGRSHTWDDSLPSLSLADIAKLDFCLAIEDSPEMVAFLAEEMRVDVVLMDRPWNRQVRERECEGGGSIARCRGWDEVAARFPRP